MISNAFLSELFAGGIVLFTVIAMGKPRLPALLRNFGLSSFCLAGLMIGIAILHEDPHLYTAAAGTIIFKVIFIPWILLYAAKRAKMSMALKFYARPAMTYFVVAIVLGLAYFTTNQLPIESKLELPAYHLLFNQSLLFVCISLVLAGLSFMILRRDLYSQIIGFLTMENGIAAFGVVAVGGVPLLVEMGIFFVLTISAILMSTLSKHVQELYATGDTTHLRELTD